MYNIIMALDITICMIFGVAVFATMFIIIKKRTIKKHKEKNEQKIWDSWVQHPQKTNTLVNENDNSEFYF